MISRVRHVMLPWPQASTVNDLTRNKRDLRDGSFWSIFLPSLGLLSVVRTSGKRAGGAEKAGGDRPSRRSSLWEPLRSVLGLERWGAMNDEDVSRQIEQMVKFIRQEAEEKANEISVAAEEEFNIEKLQLVEAEKRKIRQEYERKEKQVEVRRRIEYSMQLNASRLKVLQAQDNLVNSIKDSAFEDLLHVSDDTVAYSRLLKDLIVQALLRLKEPSVLLRCREVDLTLVESVLDEAKKEYSAKANIHVPKVTIDEHVYLPPPPSQQGESGVFCSGGVVLASQDGKIVCENTLDARLEVVFRQKLPEIRKLLLGQSTV